MLVKAIALTDEPLPASRLRRRLGYVRIRRNRMEAARATLDEAEALRPYVERHAMAKQRAGFLSLLRLSAMREERYVLSARTEEIARAAFDASIEAGE